MAIDRKYIKNLGGKDYPTWPGVLHEATERGLKSIEVTPIQIPSAENGNMAVVIARAEFEGGRVFTEVGDCSPQSLGKNMGHLAAAALRMAATRAKGRALRDALDIGETMFEELAGNDDEERPPARSPSKAAEKPVQRADGPRVHCATCASALSDAEAKFSVDYAEAFDAKPYCTKHGKPLVKAWREAQQVTPAAEEGPFDAIPEAA